MTTLIDALGGRLAFGADYNPEQWPEETRTEDVALMREAGVTMVSVGIFSWSLLEPEPGRFEFGWLDRVVDQLHGSGIAVDLATATASTPPWFSEAHPAAMLVDDHGVRRSFGSRQAWCPSSPVYRDAARELAGRLAERYAEHPAVVMWHVNNELGCHNWHCYCEVSGADFRRWLEARYGEVGELNDAWGTSFWSQRYTDWSQVQPPRAVSYASFANPTQQLDWWRFSSDALLECYRGEVSAIRAHAQQPITTNFMGFFKPADYRRWAEEQDLVSNDHYLLADAPDPTQHLAMTADLLRSLAGGGSWLLMEHSTSAVNWQPRNLAKEPGQMRRNSFQHVARGADGLMFFQWRASRAGAEKYHSAMVPHAGVDSDRWREVAALGRDVAAVAELAGSRVDQPSVAMVLDWPSWWAATLDSHPSVDVDPVRTLARWHHWCWSENVTVDLVGSGDELAGYRVVVLPIAYVLDDDAVDRLTRWVRAGGTLVATYFTGIVDGHDHVRLGGYPGALRDLLGVRVEEFHPLPEGGSVALSDFDAAATLWSELGRATDAEVLATYAEGPCAGSPAITRRRVGEGWAWYVGTELSDQALHQVGGRVLAEAGVQPVLAGLPPRVEAVRRSGARGTYLVVVNHSDVDADLPLAGTDLLTGESAERHVVAAGDVAVIRES
jgi:beta-galactosidase